VPGKHGAIGNGDVLTRRGVASALGITTRLDGHAIIPYADVAVADVYVAAGAGIDAVGVGGRRVIDGDAGHGHIIAEFGIDGPERGVHKGHTFNADMLAPVSLKKGRPEKSLGQRTFPIRIVFYHQFGVGLIPEGLVTA